MSKSGRKMSLMSRSLRIQLVVAFCLTSVIPILALLNFIFPSLFPKSPMPVVAGALLTIIVLGFLLIKRMVDPIIEITSQVKGIVRGELSGRLDIVRDDEIGELSNALNQMTQRIKDHMDELKIYGERTKDINLQVNKQVSALSGLLQISNFIAKGTALKDIFEITMSRLTQLGNSSLAFLIFEKDGAYEVKVHFGLEAQTLAAINDVRHRYIFKDLLSAKHYFKIDKTTPKDAVSELLKFFRAQNFLIYPLMVQKKPFGLLGIGNQLGSFEYLDDDLELLNIFARQLAIAIENDLLLRKVEDLEVKDALTGLYNRRYIITRLEEEILRAISHQGPCAFLHVKVKNLRDIQARSGDLAVEDMLCKIANLLKTNVSNVNMDRVGRIEADEFGMILPEKNKRQANEMASQLQDKIQQFFVNEDSLRKPNIVLSVVENPIDGSDAATLLEKAKNP